MLKDEQRKEIIKKVWDKTPTYEFTQDDRVVVNDMLWRLSLMIEQVAQNQDVDSIEMGSASKHGKVKIYGDFSDIEKFKEKIDNAKTTLDYANSIIVTR